MSPITLLTLRLTICSLGLFCFAQFIVSLWGQRNRTRFDLLFLVAAVLNILTYIGLGWWTVSELFFDSLRQPWLTATAALGFCAGFLLPLGLDYLLSFLRGNQAATPRWTWLIYLPAVGVFLAILSKGSYLFQPRHGGWNSLAILFVGWFFLYMIPITIVQTIVMRRMIRRGLDPRERGLYTWAAILLAAEVVNWVVCYVIGAGDFADPYSLLHLGTMFLPIPVWLVIAYYNYRFTFLDVILKRLATAVDLVVLGFVYQLVVEPRVIGLIERQRPQSVLVARVILLLGFVLTFLALRRLLLKVIDQSVLRRADYHGAFIEFHQGAALEGTRAGLINGTMQLLKTLLGAGEGRFVPWNELDPPLPKEIIITRPLEHGSLYATRESLDAAAIVAVPVATANHAFGLIELGRRRHDAPYLSDEIKLLEVIAHELASALNQIELLERQKQQEQQAQRLRELATRAELRALQSQINPHFLFNSLNTVAGLIQTEPDKAERMIENLAEVFRYALDGSKRDLVTLGEEVDFARTYLDIERQRFEERLVVEVSFDARLSGIRVPAMILQPLVENAVKHGIAPKVGPGWVGINISTRNGSVHVEVADDGVGIKESVANERGEYRPLSGGVGISNVDQRLRFVYGEGAALAFERRTPSGTKVFFDIPRVAV